MVKLILELNEIQNYKIKRLMLEKDFSNKQQAIRFLIDKVKK